MSLEGIISARHFVTSISKAESVCDRRNIGGRNNGKSLKLVDMTWKSQINDHESGYDTLSKRHKCRHAKIAEKVELLHIVEKILSSSFNSKDQI